MQKKHLLKLSCLLFFTLLICWTTPALADAKAALENGLQEFKALLESPEKAQYRSHWMQVKEHFQKAYAEAPERNSAAKALFYTGRTYQELGKRSFLEADFQKAIDYLQQVVQEFPDHDKAQKAKFYQAKIHKEHLQNPEQAYLDLLYIEYNYPQGHMFSRAKAMLRELDKKFMKKVGIAPEKQEILSETPKQQDKKKEHKKDLQTDIQIQEEDSKAASGKTLLKDIRHWSGEDYTRVVLDLEQDTDFEHMVLEPDQEAGSPHRLVVDLKQSEPGENITDSINIEDGILSKVRCSKYGDQKSRVVLDIENLEDYKIFSLQNPFRVVLDLHAEKKQEQSLAEKDILQGFTLDEHSKAMSKSLVEQLGLGIQTIMIDPGHGGKDPGAVAAGLKEKDVALRFSKILGEILEERGFDVLYTRDQDVFVSLEKRTAMANSKDVDLFVSVHANAHRNTRVNGFEVYYLNLAQSEDAKRVAARENAVSTNKISDLQMILTDLMLHSKINESENLAENVLNATVEYGQRFYSFNDNGVRGAPFYVLMGAQMPAMLLELGYITNPTDRENMQSYAYLKRMAWGVANGIEKYKQSIQEYASL